MKKIALCGLAITLVVLIIIMNMLPKITSNSDGYWEEVFSCSFDKDSKFIKIYKYDTSWCWGYNSWLRFETTEIKEIENTQVLVTNTYTTKKHVSIGPTALTAYEISGRDSILRNLNLIQMTEHLNAYDQIINNPTDYLSLKIKNDSEEILTDELLDAVSGTVDVAIKDALGFKTPIIDFVNETKGTIELNDKLVNKLFELLDILKIIEEKALEKISDEESTTLNYYKELFNKTAHEMYNGINSIYTETNVEQLQMLD